MNQLKLKVGDLVKFYTVDWDMDRYPPCGVIIDIHSGSHKGAPESYTVVWAGASKKTVEWSYHLRKLS